MSKLAHSLQSGMDALDLRRALDGGDTDVVEDFIVSHDVLVSYVCPPIPTQMFDWQAWVDGREEGASGHGPTRLDAVVDLFEKLYY